MIDYSNIRGSSVCEKSKVKDILLDSGAYNAYVYNAYVYYRAENPDGSLVVKYGKAPGYTGGTAYVSVSPVYVKFGNSNLVTYNDYQFFVNRR